MLESFNFGDIAPVIVVLLVLAIAVLNVVSATPGTAADDQALEILAQARDAFDPKDGDSKGTE